MDALPTTPSGPSTTRWIHVALLLAVATLLVVLTTQYDERIVGWIRFDLLPSDSTRYRIVKFSQWFTGWIPCGVFIAVLLISANRYRLVLGFAIPLLLTIGLTHLTKLLLGRARPEKFLGPADFTFLGDPREGFDSFPSGHVSFAVAMALLFGTVFPRLRIPFLFFAVLTALTRIAQARHYASDVLAAAAFAILLVQVFRRRLGPEYYCWTRPDKSASGKSI